MKNTNLIDLSDNEMLQLEGGRAGDAAYAVGFASVLTTFLVCPPLYGLAKAIF